ncbi:MAG: CCA tRNA nucleotidyltransferase [Clostridia bacterium]
MPGLSVTRLPADARRLWQILSAHGTTWLVGGAVRDILLETSPGDVDLATALHPSIVRELASAHGYRTMAVGQEFGRVAVLTSAGVVDVTTFREEGEYADGRHPACVRFTTDGMRDLLRRDFTMNAMAMTPEGGLIDPTGGLTDVAAGVIRAVGSPYERVAEDHLRILRAIRFTAYGPGRFELEADLQDAITGRSAELMAMPAARRGAEWNAILRHPWPDRALETGARCRLWAPWERGGPVLAALSDPAARLLALQLTYDMRQLGRLEWPRELRLRARRIGRMLAGQDPVCGEEGASARELADWLGRPDPVQLVRGEEVMRLFHLDGRAVGDVLSEQRRLLEAATQPLSREALIDELGRFVQNLRKSSD